MPVFPRIRNPVRLALLILLSVATSVIFTGIVPVPPGTGVGSVLLIAVIVTDLLHEYSPDTSDPDDGPQPPAGPEPVPDLDTDSLLINAWRDDW